MSGRGGLVAFCLSASGGRLSENKNVQWSKLLILGTTNRIAGATVNVAAVVFYINNLIFAGIAELADALDLGSVLNVNLLLIADFSVFIDED